jgi:uncharacterized OsmC-like protein
LCVVLVGQHEGERGLHRLCARRAHPSEDEMSTTSISDALRRVGEVMTADPAKARTKGTPATARLLEDLRFEVTGPTGEGALTDMPAAMGGGSSAPAPSWLLRAALASCTASVIALRAAQTGVHLSALEITVESETDQRGMLGLDETVTAALSSLRVSIRIGADDASPDDLRALVAWGDAHSPVASTVRRSPVTVLEVEIV